MATLEVVLGGPPEVVSIRGGELIGRNPTCEVVLADRQVSRSHLLIAREGPDWVLRDLGSANGTYVNGCRICGRRVLEDRDRIRLGDHLLLFRRRALSVRTPPPSPDLKQTDIFNAVIFPPGAITVIDNSEMPTRIVA